MARRRGRASSSRRSTPAATTASAALRGRHRGRGQGPATRSRRRPRHDGKAATYKDHDYYAFEDDGAAGVVDGWVVLGNVGGFKAAVDTADGGTPARGRRGLHEDARGRPRGAARLPLLQHARRSRSSSEVGGGRGARAVQRTSQGPGARHAQRERARRAPRGDAARVARLRAVPFLGRAASVAGELPADSWLALAQPDLGKTLDQLLDVFGRRSAAATRSSSSSRPRPGSTSRRT